MSRRGYIELFRVKGTDGQVATISRSKVADWNVLHVGGTPMWLTSDHARELAYALLRVADAGDAADFKALSERVKKLEKGK